MSTPDSKKQADGTIIAEYRPGGGRIVYRVYNGTCYRRDTPPHLARMLERFRQRGTRLRFVLGNQKTGREWGDVDVGYIGRSMGPISIPLVIYNRRSMGGAPLLDHCLVRVEHANKKEGGVIWRCAAQRRKEATHEDQ